MTLIRLTRLIVATLFLATATLGTVANAHAMCEEGAGYQQSGHNHQHDDGHPLADGRVDIKMADIDMTIDVPENDGKSPPASGASGSLATVCHSGSAGCPGCVTPADQALPDQATSLLVFHHASESGESADQSGNLRPPKFS